MEEKGLWKDDGADGGHVGLEEGEGGNWPSYCGIHT